MRPSPMDVDKDKEDIDELDGDFEESEDENNDGFRIRDPLNSPTANLFTTQALHTLIHEGLIDLTPAYQRDVVWAETKQMHLIDSIFRNFYIPPVIFAVQKDEEGEEVRICVDGKQRLTSIQKFFDGQIPHRDSKTKKSYWYTRSETHKNTRMDIPEDWKKHFAEKLITCVEYHDIAPGTEREIFQRVQLGVTLTAAEKLQAIASPWAEWIGELEAQHIISEDGLSSRLDWDTTRGRDYQCLAHLIYCCDGLLLNEYRIPTAQKMEKWMLRPDKPAQSFKAQIGDVLKSFWHIANSKNLDRGFTVVDKRVAPVEFVFIGVLLFVMRDYSYEERAKAILDMRKHVRTKFKDVRNNSAVGKELWNFVRSIEHPGSVDLDQVLIPPKSRKKRKGADSDGDDEYQAGSSKNFKPTSSKSRTLRR